MRGTPVPALVARGLGLTLAGVLVLTPAVLFVVSPPSPSQRTALGSLAALLVLLGLGVATAVFRVAVTVDDTHLRRRGLLRTRAVALAGATRSLEDSRTGMVQLRLRGDGGTVRVLLLSVSDLSTRGLPAEALDLLAGALEPHGRDDVTAGLRPRRRTCGRAAGCRVRRSRASPRRARSGRAPPVARAGSSTPEPSTVAPDPEDLIDRGRPATHLPARRGPRPAHVRTLL